MPLPALASIVVPLPPMSAIAEWIVVAPESIHVYSVELPPGTPAVIVPPLIE